MRNRWKRAGAMLLSLTMCASMLPPAAFAAEEEEGTGIIAEEAEMTPAEEIPGTPEEVPEEVPAGASEEEPEAVPEETPAENTDEGNPAEESPAEISEESEIPEEIQEKSADEGNLAEESPAEISEEPEAPEEMPEEAAGEETEEEVQINVDIDSEGIAVLSVEEVSGEDIAFLGDDENDLDEELAIDDVNFPDDAFRAYVSENFDTDESGTLSQEEILAVKKIDMSYIREDTTAPDPPLCRSLEGIRYFTELEYLDVYGDELSGEVDLSGLTKLTYLDCCANVCFLEDSEGIKPRITSLNLTGDAALEELYCYDNYITELDLSEFASSLTVLNCESNLIKELDVSGCTNLITLYCGRNCFDTLNVSGLQKLNWLSCLYEEEDPDTPVSSRCPLNELILDGNDALTVLQCERNALTYLDLSECTNLRTLNCEYNKLDGLDVSELTDLQTLHCSGNSPSDPDEGYEGWGYLDLSNNPELYLLECADLGLWELDLSSNPELVNLSCGDNHLTEVDLSAQETMHYLNLGYQDRWVNAFESDEMLVVSLESLVSPENIDRVLPKDPAVTLQDGYLIIPDPSLRSAGYTYSTGYVNGDMDVYLFIDETAQIDISDCSMTLSPSSCTYDGSEQTPEILVTNDGRVLTEDTDYLTGYSDNVDTGIATATIYGIGFYTGQQSKSFLINKADQKLTADVSSAKVTVGNSIRITVGGAYGALTFESADPSVAAVDGNGTVTGVSAGKATILILAAPDANHNAADKYITIEVEKAGQNVTAKAESSTIKVGSTTQIHADGIGKITYESSDPTIASVNSSGKVKGLSAGTAQITVTAYGDSATGRSRTTVTITVTEPDPDATTKTAVLHIRATAASKKKVALKWNAVENADGYVLYGAKCGGTMKELKTFKNGSRKTYKQTGLKKNTSYKFKIRAYKLVNGKKVYLKTSNTMHVTTTSRKYTNVKSIRASRTALTLRSGETQKIRTTVKLADADKKLRKHENVIKYTSSKPAVATVNSKGKITAVSRGKCTIYVYAADGIYTKVKVTVE